MGVRGLTSVVRGVGRRANLASEAKGKCIVFDGTGLVYNLVERPHSSLPVSSWHGGATLHLYKLTFDFFLRFLVNGVNIHIIMDGCSTIVGVVEKKLLTTKMRFQEKTQEAGDDDWDGTFPNLMFEVFVEAVRDLQQYWEQEHGACSSTIRLERVFVEADPECARLAREPSLDSEYYALCGTDSDFLVCGAKLYLPADSVKLGREEHELWGLVIAGDDVARQVGLPRALLPVLASLSGNDYLLREVHLTALHARLGVRGAHDVLPAVAALLRDHAAIRPRAQDYTPSDTDSLSEFQSLQQILGLTHQSMELLRSSIISYTAHGGDEDEQKVRDLQPLGLDTGPQCLLQRYVRGNVHERLVALACSASLPCRSDVDNNRSQSGTVLLPILRLVAARFFALITPIQERVPLTLASRPHTAIVKAAGTVEIETVGSELSEPEIVCRVEPFPNEPLDGPQQRLAFLALLGKPIQELSICDSPLFLSACAARFVLHRTLGHRQSWCQSVDDEEAQGIAAALLASCAIKQLANPFSSNSSRNLFGLRSQTVKRVQQLSGQTRRHHEALLSLVALHTTAISVMRSLNDVLPDSHRMDEEIMRVRDAVDGRLAHAVLALAGARPSIQSVRDVLLATQDATEALNEAVPCFDLLVAATMPTPAAQPAHARLVANPTTQAHSSGVSINALWNRLTPQPLNVRQVALPAFPNKPDRRLWQSVVEKMFVTNQQRPFGSRNQITQELAPQWMRRERDATLMASKEFEGRPGDADHYATLQRRADSLAAARGGRYQFNSNGKLVFEPQALALDPFQQEALEHLTKGDSVLVTAPTGAGKTEIALRRILQILRSSSNSKVRYVAPTVALAIQVFVDLHSYFEQYGYTEWCPYPFVGIRTRAHNYFKDARVVVTVPNSLEHDLWSLGSEARAQFACFILDEVHHVDSDKQQHVQGETSLLDVVKDEIRDGSDWSKWEKLFSLAPAQAQIIALSATVAQPSKLVDWLNERVYKKPTARHVSLADNAREIAQRFFVFGRCLHQFSKDMYLTDKECASNIAAAEERLLLHLRDPKADMLPPEQIDMLAHACCNIRSPCDLWSFHSMLSRIASDHPAFDRMLNALGTLEVAHRHGWQFCATELAIRVHRTLVAQYGDQEFDQDECIVRTVSDQDELEGSFVTCSTCTTRCSTSAAQRAPCCHISVILTQLKHDSGQPGSVPRAIELVDIYLGPTFLNQHPELARGVLIELGAALPLGNAAAMATDLHQISQRDQRVVPEASLIVQVTASCLGAAFKSHSWWHSLDIARVSVAHLNLTKTSPLIEEHITTSDLADLFAEAVLRLGLVYRKGRLHETDKIAFLCLCKDAFAQPQTVLIALHIASTLHPLAPEFSAALLQNLTDLLSDLEPGAGVEVLFLHLLDSVEDNHVICNIAIYASLPALLPEKRRPTLLRRLSESTTSHSLATLTFAAQCGSEESLLAQIEGNQSASVIEASLHALKGFNSQRREGRQTSVFSDVACDAMLDRELARGALGIRSAAHLWAAGLRPSNSQQAKSRILNAFTEAVANDRIHAVERFLICSDLGAHRLFPNLENAAIDEALHDPGAFALVVFGALALSLEDLDETMQIVQNRSLYQVLTMHRSRLGESTPGGDLIRVLEVLTESSVLAQQHIRLLPVFGDALCDAPKANEGVQHRAQEVLERLKEWGFAHWHTAALERFVDQHDEAGVSTSAEVEIALANAFAPGSDGLNRPSLEQLLRWLTALTPEVGPMPPRNVEGAFFLLDKWVCARMQHRGTGCNRCKHEDLHAHTSLACRLCFPSLGHDEKESGLHAIRALHRQWTTKARSLQIELELPILLLLLTDPHDLTAPLVENSADTSAAALFCIRWRQRQHFSVSGRLIQRPFGLEPHVSSLIDELQQCRMLPAIIFVYGIDDVQLLATMIVGSKALPRPAAAHHKLIEAAISRLISSGSEPRADELGLWVMLRRGVGMHHSRMSTEWLLEVEGLFRLGVLQVVVSTSTLAVGIHMPCATTVFVRRRVRLHSVAEFRQMAGRAGRRGLAVGETGVPVKTQMISGAPVGNVVFCGFFAEGTLQERLAGEPEPLRGAYIFGPETILDTLAQLAEPQGQMAPECAECKKRWFVTKRELDFFKGAKKPISPLCLACRQLRKGKIPQMDPRLQYATAFETAETMVDRSLALFQHKSAALALSNQIQMSLEVLVCNGFVLASTPDGQESKVPVLQLSKLGLLASRWKGAPHELKLPLIMCLPALGEALKALGDSAKRRRTLMHSLLHFLQDDRSHFRPEEMARPNVPPCLDELPAQICERLTQYNEDILRCVMRLASNQQHETDTTCPEASPGGALGLVGNTLELAANAIRGDSIGMSAFEGLSGHSLTHIDCLNVPQFEVFLKGRTGLRLDALPLVMNVNERDCKAYVPALLDGDGMLDIMTQFGVAKKDLQWQTIHLSTVLRRINKTLGAIPPEPWADVIRETIQGTEEDPGLLTVVEHGLDRVSQLEHAACSSCGKAVCGLQVAVEDWQAVESEAPVDSWEEQVEGISVSTNTQGKGSVPPSQTFWSALNEHLEHTDASNTSAQLGTMLRMCLAPAQWPSFAASMMEGLPKKPQLPCETFIAAVSKLVLGLAKPGADPEDRHLAPGSEFAQAFQVADVCLDAALLRGCGPSPDTWLRLTQGFPEQVASILKPETLKKAGARRRFWMLNALGRSTSVAELEAASAIKWETGGVLDQAGGLVRWGDRTLSVKSCLGAAVIPPTPLPQDSEVTFLLDSDLSGDPDQSTTAVASCPVNSTSASSAASDGATPAVRFGFLCGLGEAELCVHDGGLEVVAVKLETEQDAPFGALLELKPDGSAHVVQLTLASHVDFRSRERTFTVAVAHAGLGSVGRAAISGGKLPSKKIEEMKKKRDRASGLVSATLRRAEDGSISLLGKPEAVSGDVAQVGKASGSDVAVPTALTATEGRLLQELSPFTGNAATVGGSSSVQAQLGESCSKPPPPNNPNATTRVFHPSVVVLCGTPEQAERTVGAMRHVAHGARVGHLDRAWSLAGLTPADPSDGTFLAAYSESLLDVAVALGLGSQLHALVVSDATLPALRWLVECNLVVLPPTNHVFVHPSANPDFSWAAESGSQ